MDLAKISLSFRQNPSVDLIGAPAWPLVHFYQKQDSEKKVNFKLMQENGSFRQGKKHPNSAKIFNVLWHMQIISTGEITHKH